MAHPRLVIDECLSIELPAIAHAKGFDAYHVVHRGLAGAKDHDLRARLVEDEAVLVTNNGEDFLKLYEGEDLHPGLIIIVPNVRAEDQKKLFHAALKAIGKRSDLVNRVIEVHSPTDVREYEWPKGKG